MHNRDQVHFLVCRLFELKENQENSYHVTFYSKSYGKYIEYVLEKMIGLERRSRE